MIRQSLSQKLQQKMTPQQIQMMNMLTLPTLAFEDYVKEELEANPALSDEIQQDGRDADNQSDDADFGQDDTYDTANQEHDSYDFNLDPYISDDEIPEYRLYTNNYSDQQQYHVPYSQSQSFTEHLLEQLGTLPLNEKEKTIGQYIIGNIEPDGYLRRELSSISDDLAFSNSLEADTQQIEQVLRMIQSFEPAGVGARNLQESLLIQLAQQEPSHQTETAQAIIRDHFDLFVKKNYEKLLEKIGCDKGSLSRAIARIGSLNPRPGFAFSDGDLHSEQIIPDFTIHIEDNEPEVSLNNQNSPELFVSREYNELLKSFQATSKPSRDQQQAAAFVKGKIDSARWFIDAVRQRESTLLRTMKAIVELQRDFIVTGQVRNLRPLTLKDVAEKLELDVSTVSRVVGSKYVTTPMGTFSLKEFFSGGMTTDQGEDVATKQIKDFLRQTIEEEDKSDPLTDEQLKDVLNDQGYPVARRTVAKYREMLGFSVARLRRAL